MNAHSHTHTHISSFYYIFIQFCLFSAIHMMTIPDTSCLPASQPVTFVTLFPFQMHDDVDDDDEPQNPGTTNNTKRMRMRSSFNGRVGRRWGKEQKSQVSEYLNLSTAPNDQRSQHSTKVNVLAFLRVSSVFSMLWVWSSHSQLLKFQLNAYNKNQHKTSFVVHLIGEDSSLKENKSKVYYIWWRRTLWILQFGKYTRFWLQEYRK